MKKHTGVIYRIFNKISNKSYIGQTVNFKKRLAYHFYNPKYYIGRAINKYDKESFECEILCDCNSKEELDEMEFHYIKQYNTFRPNGYNLTMGGEGSSGWIPTEETKRNISKSLTGRKLPLDVRQKIGKAGKGRIFTDEHKKKLSEANSGEKNPMYGKHLSEETKRKLSDALSGENHPMWGKYHTEEAKRIMSEKASLRTGEKNHFTGKHHTDEAKKKIGTANKGKKRTDEFKKMKSESSKGKGNPMYGRKQSEETKRKISEKAKARALKKKLEKEKLNGIQ